MDTLPTFSSQPPPSQPLQAAPFQPQSLTAAANTVYQPAPAAQSVSPVQPLQPTSPPPAQPLYQPPMPVEPESVPALPPSPPPKRSSLLVTLLGLLAILVIIGGGAFYLWQQRQQTSELTPSPSPAPTFIPEGVACTMEALICPDGSAVGRSGPNCEFAPCPSASPVGTPSASASPAAGEDETVVSFSEDMLSFSYPSTFQVQNNADGVEVTLTRKGSTQQSGTLSNGAVVNFFSAELNGQTLEQWVDAEIQRAVASGTQLTKSKAVTTVNGYPGFSFTLNNTVNQVVQKNSSSVYAVNIKTQVRDPQQQGFQTEVDQIVASLRIQR